MRDLYLQRKLWSQLLKKVFPLSSLTKLARFSALKRHLFLSSLLLLKFFSNILFRIKNALHSFLLISSQIFQQKLKKKD